MKNATRLGFFAWIIEREEETPFVKLMEEIVLIIALTFFSFYWVVKPLSYIEITNREMISGQTLRKKGSVWKRWNC